MTYRSSFSQHNTFCQCQYYWYLSSIKKLEIISDMCYANAGDVVHKCLEFFYKNKSSIEEVKNMFEIKWKEKKLDQSIIKHKFSEYWIMILNGINLNINLTSTELKIYYPDIIAYLDMVNTTEDIISDWKTSTRSEENEKEYKRQLTLYSWIYYRHFGVILDRHKALESGNRLACFVKFILENSQARKNKK